jgi:hypothetical protein
MFDGLSQAISYSAVLEPGATLGDVWADLLPIGVSQVPEFAFQVDERFGGRRQGGPKSLISWLTGSSACLVAGRTATGGHELAEQL